MKLEAPWLNWPAVRQLFMLFTQAGYELRFVGGCVRDSVLGREVKELDAASNATPDQMIALLERAGIRTIPTGIEHGTITALVGDRSFEITTLRKDIATDGRHAEVAFTDEWNEDAKRRDFTMNALYVDGDGNIHDEISGLEDCKQRYVRFIGDADARIREDYLRILRYFRFVAQLESNHFDPHALQACKKNAEGIRQLSGERITVELLKLLAVPCAPVIGMMEEAGIITLIFPHAHIPLNAMAILDKHDAYPLVKLALFIGSEEHIGTVSAWLKLSGRQQTLLKIWLQHYSKITGDMNALAQKKLVRRFGVAEYIHLLQLAEAFGQITQDEYAHLEVLASWRPPLFPVSAEDLMQRGYEEGKALGDALRKLEQAWEESEYSLSKEQLLTLLPS